MVFVPYMGLSSHIFGNCVKQDRLLIRVEDTGYVTIEHRLTNLLFLLFSSFFCPFVFYCFKSTVSSTRSKIRKTVAIHIFQSGVRIWPAGVSRRDIEVFNPQA